VEARSPLDEGPLPLPQFFFFLIFNFLFYC
jgi:hypothetical protein